MRRGEKYKMHKVLMKAIRKFNKDMINDNWFNGRFYAILHHEKFFNYNDLEIIPGEHKMTMNAYIMLLDKLNPLNCCAFYQFQIFYNRDNVQEPFRYEFYLNFGQTANSWIQFCCSGRVLDCPSHFHYFEQPPFADEYVNKQSTWNAGEEEINYLGKCIQEFSANYSFVHNKNNRINSIEETVNNKYVFNKYKRKGDPNDENFLKKKAHGYSPCGLLWKYKHGFALVNDENQFLCMFVKNRDAWYGLYFKEYNTSKKVNLDYPCDEYELYGYKLGKSLEPLFEKFDNGGLKLWLNLNGFDDL